jgi:Alternative oxidase.
MILISGRRKLPILSLKQGVQVTKIAIPNLFPVCQVGFGYSIALRVAATAPRLRDSSSSTRSFTTTCAKQLRDIFPAKETALIRRTPPAWPHHGFTQEELESAVPAHRKPRTMSDWIAYKFVRTCRWFMDLATGMKPGQKPNMQDPRALVAEKPLTEAQWLGMFPCRAGSQS